MKFKLLKNILYLVKYYGIRELLECSMSFLDLKYILYRQRFFGKYTIRNKKNIYIGRNIKAYHNFFLEAHGEGVIYIGDGCVFNRNIYISSFSEINIGSDCLFGPNIYIGDHDHGLYKGQNQSSPYEKPVNREIIPKKIFIGKNVWCGNNVTITKGAYVGDGAIIGANSVVIGKIPPYSISAGSPAIVKKVYSHERKLWENLD